MCLVDLDVSKDGAASDVKNHFSVIIKSVHKKKGNSRSEGPSQAVVALSHVERCIYFPCGTFEGAHTYKDEKVYTVWVNW